MSLEFLQGCPTEDSLKRQIKELAESIHRDSDRRDYLIGRVVAIETKGMGYNEMKAFSLGIRWYSCKDRSHFNEGYRETAGQRW
jgi:hypothetical protein